MNPYPLAHTVHHSEAKVNIARKKLTYNYGKEEGGREGGRKGGMKEGRKEGGEGKER